MSKKSILIRCDGSAKIGLGHALRCISLAKMLEKEFKIHFFSVHMPQVQIEEIYGIGCSFTQIENEKEFLLQLQENQIAVLDGYHFNSNYQKRIKEKNVALVCIDDFHNQHFYSDLIINHAPGVTEADYESESYTSYLLGPKYALLRPEFLDNHSKRRRAEINEVKKLLICLGGSDYSNITSKILENIPANRFEIVVVVGNAFSQKNELNELIKNLKNIDITLKSSLSAEEMRDEMERADFGIFSASGILLESLSLKLPTISGYYISNQKEMYTNFLKENLIIGIGDFNIKNLVEILKNPDLIERINNLIHVLNNSKIGGGIQEIKSSFNKL